MTAPHAKYLKFPWKNSCFPHPCVGVLIVIYSFPARYTHEWLRFGYKFHGKRSRTWAIHSAGLDGGRCDKAMEPAVVEWLPDSEAPVCGRDSMSLAAFFGRIVEAQARACFFPVIFWDIYKPQLIPSVLNELEWIALSTSKNLDQRLGHSLKWLWACLGLKAIDLVSFP